MPDIETPLASPTLCDTIAESLRIRAEIEPTRMAFTFLEDGERATVSLTYGELDYRARCVATQLRALNARGKRALLLYPPGLDFIVAFFGCLYAGVIAVPIPPPRRNQNLERVNAVVDDAQANIALTTKQTLELIGAQIDRNARLADLTWKPTDAITDFADSAEVFETTPQDLAFLQYTSGSTSAPKGVMVSHANLMRNLDDLDRGWEHSSESLIVSWLPNFHDMGLIYGILLPVFRGFPCYQMSPAAFLQRPARWLQAMTTYRATHACAPNFAYDLCTNKISAEQRAELDLRSWEVAVNGAEPVRASTLNDFAEAFAECGFRYETFAPGYGLAEATLKVCAVRKNGRPRFVRVQTQALERHYVVIAEEDKGAQTLVGCGVSEIDTEIVIVNPQTLLQCASDEVGEIWLRGTTLAQGYWRRSVETAESFEARLADTGAGPYFRTGDLGFMHNGELYVTGRIKDVIIIRGQNYYPQDIELTAQNSHAALRHNCGAAFTISDGNAERLVVVNEIERTAIRDVNVDEIGAAIREAIAQERELEAYDVVLLKPGGIPKTSSGKIQRNACKIAYLGGVLPEVGRSRGANGVAYTNGIQRDNGVTSHSDRPRLAEEWIAEWLAKERALQPADLDRSASFFQLGVDSLTAARLHGDLEEWLGRSLDQHIIWDHPSIEALARALSTTSNAPATRNSERKPQERAIALQRNGAQHRQKDAVAATIATDVDTLSDEEVEALLHSLVEGEDRDG